MDHTTLVAFTITLCLAVLVGTVWLIAHAGIVRGASHDRRLLRRRRGLAAAPHADPDRIVE